MRFRLLSANPNGIASGIHALTPRWLTRVYKNLGRGLF
jgi:hypothetical protein